MPFTIIILFVFLSHPIKIYHLLSRSTTPFFCLTISSLPHSFLLPFALFCFTPPSFSQYSLQLPLYHHWSIKIRFTDFFFLFPIFFGSLLSVLWSDIPNRKFISELPIRRSIWATTDLLSTISQIPPSAHYKISFTGYFSPFFPIFFSLSPLCSMISHTESV